MYEMYLENWNAIKLAHSKQYLFQEITQEGGNA